MTADGTHGTLATAAPRDRPAPDETTELRRMAARLRVLHEAARDFAAATADPARLFERIARTVSDVLGDLCAIRLLTDDGQALDAPVALHHPDPEIVEVARVAMSFRQRLDQGAAGPATATARPRLVRVADRAALIAQAPEARELIERQRIASVMAVPLLADGASIGVVTMTRSEGLPPYDEDDLALLEDLTVHAALAITNSRLLEASRRALRERQRTEDALHRTEAQLRQSQKMEAIGRLAGGVAHDFNNLLSVILSYADIILADLPATAPLRPDLEEIRLAGRKAAALTRQLLAFSRQQVIAPRVVDLNAIVAAMGSMVRRVVGEDVVVRTVAAAGHGRCNADPSQREQVLLNLVVNARDAMPAGGHLTIETADVELDDDHARRHLGVTPGAHVMLAVSDTGHGMDRETQERIFEPFFTTKELGKGTGLGLSTVFGIVQQNGGTIWVYSEPGRGTTFKIYLPRTDDPVGAVAEPVAVGPLRGSETILLVEDDDQLRVVSRGMLERAGYTVLAACHGADALLQATRHPGPIDLVLTDVVMPRMSGREVARRLTALRPGIRVLYMSGYTEDAIVHHGVLDPGSTLLQKPITPDTLGRAVRQVLARAAPPTTPPSTAEG